MELNTKLDKISKLESVEKTLDQAEGLLQKGMLALTDAQYSHRNLRQLTAWNYWYDQ